MQIKKMGGRSVQGPAEAYGGLFPAIVADGGGTIQCADKRTAIGVWKKFCVWRKRLLTQGRGEEDRQRMIEAYRIQSKITDEGVLILTSRQEGMGGVKWTRPGGEEVDLQDEMAVLEAVQRPARIEQ